nr:GNAT family N-acetyltransferase [Geomicrobium halophilum]
MEIKQASINHAPVIHNVMIQAFMEYSPPSSALEETIQSISTALEDGEQSFISYMNDEPAGVVRFQMNEHHLYFYRLSVPPEKRGMGVAKGLLQSLEDVARQNKKTTMLCNVRKNLPKNIQMYHSLGYNIYDEKVVHQPNGLDFEVACMMKQLTV